MGDRRETVRYEEASARGSIYPLLSLGPPSWPCMLAKTWSTLNLETSQNSLTTTCIGTPGRICAI
jgi:hypothetical protein